jgi:hypothetical protein
MMRLRQELRRLIDLHTTCTMVDREMLIDEILRILREQVATRVSNIRNSQSRN